MSKICTTQDFYAPRYNGQGQIIARMYIATKKIYDYIQKVNMPDECVCGGTVETYEVDIDGLYYYFPAEFVIEVSDEFVVDDRDIYTAIQDRLQDPTTNYKQAYLEKLGIDIEADLNKPTPLYREARNPGENQS